MTAVLVAGGRPVLTVQTPEDVIPPLGPGLQLARASLVLLTAMSFGLVLQMLVVSTLQQRSAQQHSFSQFRDDLARGTAPIGPIGTEGRALRPGAAVAYLEIPSIGVRQIVGEGTSGGELFAGPGHRRDTPFPGQVGSSVVFGRRAAFGGPFARIGDLRPGAIIRTTTGQGTFDYKVTGLRRPGDPAPGTLQPGTGRMLLVTAGGRPFMPSGVLRVDADLVGPGVAASTRRIASNSLSPSEQIMAADSATLWALALWLQALTVVVLSAIWAWHRWSRAKAWVVFLPPLLVVALGASGEAARLLPNML